MDWFSASIFHHPLYRAWDIKYYTPSPLNIHMANIRKRFSLQFSHQLHRLSFHKQLPLPFPPAPVQPHHIFLALPTARPWPVHRHYVLPHISFSRIPVPLPQSELLPIMEKLPLFQLVSFSRPYTQFPEFPQLPPQCIPPETSSWSNKCW